MHCRLALHRAGWSLPMRSLRSFSVVIAALLLSIHAFAAIFATLQGVVHDPQHRPIAGATVEVHAAHSDFTKTLTTGRDGTFVAASLPLGDYIVTVKHPGFATDTEAITLASDTAPTLHVELPVGTVQQSVTVAEAPGDANVDTATPTTLVDRETIAETPGADRTNSMAMITDFTPGAYMTHDMLHMRGGHQLSWLIDGVEIPNTNIASNVAAQIDPKDIDYLEVQRGSYSADLGDRTYGIFNVVPRSGFERNREAELVMSAGNFLATDDALNFGDHSEKAAYYVSFNGNRSDYGLAPPIGAVHHDAANGYGGFASLIDNATPSDQLRLILQLRHDFFQIPYDPDPNSFENQQYNSSGLRDTQSETDGVVAFTYLHTFSQKTVLQISPFYHYNDANYEPGANDAPDATTSKRASTYYGAQVQGSTIVARNSAQVGLYSFGQHDADSFANIFNDGSGTAPVAEFDAVNGGVVEGYISDNYKPTSWLTLIAGLRATRFEGGFTETATSPRFGASLRVPKLGWVFRGFYGHFYQPPPLLTAGGSLAAFAQANSTGFAPLHGERDEEHQFGVTIPLPRPAAGWSVDIDTFKTRISNFLDHSNIGESSLYFPVTIENARVRAWEATLRSPRLWRFGQAHLAYSNQIAESQGAITGGLVCANPADCYQDTYAPVDHDQRNTLNVGFDAHLPWQVFASTNVYYGSGFVNGAPDPSTPYPNDYLPQHTTFDVAVGKNFSRKLSVQLVDANAANHRVLLDNSLTFGGFHYNDPRTYYAQVKYRFHF